MCSCIALRTNSPSFTSTSDLWGVINHLQSSGAPRGASEQTQSRQPKILCTTLCTFTGKLRDAAHSECLKNTSLGIVC